jgi:hypothetical protein
MQRSTLVRRCRGDEAGEIAIWWGSIWCGGSDIYARARAKTPSLSLTRIPDSDLATSECECCAGERWCAALPLVCLTLTSALLLCPIVPKRSRVHSGWECVGQDLLHSLLSPFALPAQSNVFGHILSFFFETSGQYNPTKQEVEYFILAPICSIQGKTKLLTCCEQFWKAWDLTWWIWDCACIIISLYKSFRYTIVKKNTTN